MVIYYNPNTTQTKNVSFYDDSIFTIVTKDPNVVSAWISETTENTNGRRLVIGLDTEWRPSFQRGVENPVAILQLCVDHRCLIFQIIHAPYTPQSLFDFLNNPNYTFTGAGIHTDVAKLVQQYGLGGAANGRRLAANVVDVAAQAAYMHNLDRNGLSLKALTKMFLGKELEKPPRVTMSNWENQRLFDEQIDYATIDACVLSDWGMDLI